MARYLLASILVCMSHLAVAQVSPQQRHGQAFGTFTSLRYIPESGDLLGYEITIIPQYMSAYVIFQCAEGQPGPPVLVPVKIEGLKVSFDVIDEQNACKGHYSGTVSSRGLRLKFAGDDSPEFLPRKRSYWEP